MDTNQCVELTRWIPAGNQAEETPKNEAPENSKNEVSKSNQTPEGAGAGSIGEGRWTEARTPSPSETELDLRIWSHQNWFPNIVKIAYPDNIITQESYEALWRTSCSNSTTSGEKPEADFATVSLIGRTR